MSRIDDALRRAGVLPGPAARVDLRPGGRLQHYKGEPRFGGEPRLTAVGAAADARAARTAPPPPDEVAPVPPVLLRALDPAFKRKTVMDRRASPMLVEQFRRLAVAVHELQVEQGLRMLLITSTLPNEGKTLTTVNLALTLSESCMRRVLLIDADVRRPFVHQVFQLPNEGGLGLALGAGEGQVVPVQVSQNLSILPAGQVDQPMALASERMGRLLEECTASFDIVLIDSAPVGVMPDAQLLARLTRAVLFVIAAHTTPQALVTRAIADVGQELVIGTVLNGVAEHEIPAAGYYNEYYAARRPAE